MSNNTIDWTDIIKKEARGLNDADFGEVHEIRQENIVTKSGIVDKQIYSIPKRFVERYDGSTLWFKLTKEEADNSYKIKD